MKAAGRTGAKLATPTGTAREWSRQILTDPARRRRKGTGVDDEGHREGGPADLLPVDSGDEDPARFGDEDVHGLPHPFAYDNPERTEVETAGT